MRAALVAFVLTTFAAVPSATLAGSTRHVEIRCLKGTVSYAVAGGETRALSHDEVRALQRNAAASTAADSLGAVAFADGSSVLFGADTSVELAGVANASPSLNVAQGAVRFAMRVPKDDDAHYRLRTPSASLELPAAQGDLFTSATRLTVNVYSIDDPTKTVRVRLGDRAFELRAGQSLDADLTAKPARVAISPITTAASAPFAQFGAPPRQPVLGKIKGLWQSFVANVVDKLLVRAAQQAAPAPLMTPAVAPLVPSAATPKPPIAP